MKKMQKKTEIPAIALEGEKALKAAVAEVLEEHRRIQFPMAVWHQGKAVLLTPDKAVSTVREKGDSYGEEENVQKTKPQKALKYGQKQAKNA